jgi:hypothetical protein
MSVEVDLIRLDYDRRWEILISINTLILGELTKTHISLDEPYRSSREEWKTIMEGAPMLLSHGFSLKNGYYRFDSASEYGTNFCTLIKEEVLRDKLSEVIDRAIELNLRFDCDED